MQTSTAQPTVDIHGSDREQRRRFVALALSMAAVGACGSTPAAALPTATVSYAVMSDASGYLSRLNGERASHGLAPLVMRSDLTQIAQSWSAHMAATGVLSHNPSLASEVTNWLAVGENVGDGPSISDLDAAFMASPKHRANVLDPTYDDVGIGTVTRDGTIWITVDFRDVERPEPVTRAATQTRTAVVRTTTWRPSAWTAPRSAGLLMMLGTVGTRVQLIQRRLHVSADGIFGPITRRAVEGFQRRRSLVVDGIVGPRTWAALRQHPHAKRPAARRTSGLSLFVAG